MLWLRTLTLGTWTACVLVMGCGDSDADAGDGSDAGRGGDYPDGCEFLDETVAQVRCFGDEARCERVQTSSERYDLWLRIDETATDANGDDVRYTGAELDARIDCAVQWLTGLGFEPEADRQRHVIITASWDEASDLVERAVFSGYQPQCAGDDCSYCEALDMAACEDDPFCAPERGRVYDPVGDCLQPERFAGCLRGDGGCTDAETYAQDGEGACWFFSSGCGLAGFDYEACDDWDGNGDRPGDCE
jgi:hypothetical protein